MYMEFGLTQVQITFIDKILRTHAIFQSLEHLFLGAQKNRLMQFFNHLNICFGCSKEPSH